MPNQLKKKGIKIGNSKMVKSKPKQKKPNAASGDANVTVTLTGPPEKVTGMLMRRDTNKVRIRGINAPGDNKKFRIVLGPEAKTKWHQKQGEYWRTLDEGLQNEPTYDDYQTMKENANQTLMEAKIDVFKEQVNKTYTSINTKPSKHAKKAQSVLNKMQKRLDKFNEKTKPHRNLSDNAWLELKPILATFYHKMAETFNEDTNAKDAKHNKHEALVEKRESMHNWKATYKADNDEFPGLNKDGEGSRDTFDTPEESQAGGSQAGQYRTDLWGDRRHRTQARVSDLSLKYL